MTIERIKYIFETSYRELKDIVKKKGSIYHLMEKHYKNKDTIIFTHQTLDEKYKITIKKL